MLKNWSWKPMLWAAGYLGLFVIYCYGLSTDLPGFYVDESALAYNAYRLSRTGAGEFGPVLPLYFQVFTGGFMAFVSPTQFYLLAFVFLFFSPTIFVARVFSAFWVFSACLLLGYLARRISRSIAVGVVVAAIALITPWFFDLRGLLLEPHVIPMAVTLYLLVVWRTQEKDRWAWQDALLLAGSLTFITYCYTSGRILGVLLGGGLIFFATNKKRLTGVLKTGLLYGLFLVPIVVFNLFHPGIMTRRLYEVSYIKPWTPLSEAISLFISRYLQDQSLTALLTVGDYHGRHHVQGSGGAIFISTFILIILGVFLVITTSIRQPWWRFILYGAAVAIIPGALTNEPFHQMRMMAYPVFLLVLTVPAIAWLFGVGEDTDASTNSPTRLLPVNVRIAILLTLLAVTTYEAVHYQTFFRTRGRDRQFEFDTSYKIAYDKALEQPDRPIYLEDGYWGPGYIHALWYATVDGRPTSEFEHLEEGQPAPSGAVVISAQQECINCEVLSRNGSYLVYRVR